VSAHEVETQFVGQHVQNYPWSHRHGAVQQRQQHDCAQDHGKRAQPCSGYEVPAE
jgi:hypothetical protein